MDGNRARLTPLYKSDNPGTSGGVQWKAATFNRTAGEGFEVRGSFALTTFK